MIGLLTATRPNDCRSGALAGLLRADVVPSGAEFANRGSCGIADSVGMLAETCSMLIWKLGSGIIPGVTVELIRVKTRTFR